MRLDGTVFSNFLGMDTGITIVTPNKLNLEGEYKVVYLFHGLCGDHRTWLDYSLLPVFASAGKSIYIMPDAARSFFADMKHGLRYFSYLTEELPMICKNIFHISAERENTYVIGSSMGGYGALKCALSFPEQYGACAAFSSSCLFLKEGLTQFRENRSEFIRQFGEPLEADFIAAFGESGEWKPELDIVELLKSAEVHTTRPDLYLTCGTRDPFYADHLRFKEILAGTNLHAEVEFWDAQHDFYYFNSALKKAVERFSL